MQHDLVSSLLSVGGVAFAPVVADGVSEDVSSAVEAGSRDRTTNSRVTLETVLGVLVPEVESAVGASGAEGTVDRVESDRVDGENIADVTLGGGSLTVALEREVRGRVLLLDILDGATTLEPSRQRSPKHRRSS